MARLPRMMRVMKILGADHNRLEVPQKEYLTVRIEDGIGGQNERTTSKRFQVESLKVPLSSGHARTTECIALVGHIQ